MEQQPQLSLNESEEKIEIFASDVHMVAQRDSALAPVPETPLANSLNLLAAFLKTPSGEVTTLPWLCEQYEAPSCSLDEAVHAVEPSSIEVLSTVRSFHRAIDSKYDAPVTLVHGSVSRLPANPTYVRSFEVIGDLRTNLLWVEEGKETFLYPQKFGTLDLKTIEHFVVDHSRSPTPPGFHRYNLICNKVLLLRTGTDLSRYALIEFSGISGLSCKTLGIRDGVTLRELQERCVALPKCLSEAELVNAALEKAAAQGREVVLQAYLIPFRWLDQANLPDAVRQMLLAQRGGVSDVPLLYDLTKAEAMDATVRTLSMGTADVHDNVAQMAEALVKAWPSFSEKDKEQMYDALVPLQNVSGGNVIRKGALLLPEPDAERILTFSFEGQDFEVEAVVSQPFEPDAQPSVSLCPLNASPQLERVALTFGYLQRAKILEFRFVEFRASLETSCRSVTTTTKSPLEGFGVRNNLWNERLTIDAHYRGLWAFPLHERYVHWSRIIDNQFIAELVFGRLKPHVVERTVCPIPYSLQAIEKRFSEYLDSGAIHRSVVMERVPHEGGDAWGTRFSLSGLYRLLPEDLTRASLAHPKTIKVENYLDYLMGTQTLKMRLCAGGQEAIFAYEPQLNYDLRGNTPEEIFRNMKEVPKMPSEGRVPLEKAEIIPQGNAPQPKPADPPRKWADVPFSPPSEERRVPSFLQERETRRNQPTQGNAPGQPRRIYSTTTLPGLTVGDWECEAVQQLAAATKARMASRCLDILEGVSFPGDFMINRKWLETIRRNADDVRATYRPPDGRIPTQVFCTDNLGRPLILQSRGKFLYGALFQRHDEAPE